MTMFQTKYQNNSRQVSGTPQLFNDDSILRCDTSSAPVVINLLEIPADFWNTTWKLYVYDETGNAAVNNITINAGAGQTINGAASFVISTNGGSAVIRISANTKYVVTSSGTPSNGHIIQDEGVSLPQQPILDFVGSGVTVTNGIGKTIVTIPGVSITSLTNAALVALIGGSTVVPGQFYLVTDANLTDGGALVQGLTTNTVTLHGAGLFLNPDYQNTGGNNLGIWNSGLAPVAGVSIVIYEGIQYLNLTGAVGTAPPGDAVNWQPLAKSVVNTYILEVDQIRYDTALNRLLYRADKRGNEIEYVIYKTENSLAAFQWGNNFCTGNKALAGSFIGNINNGRLVNNNVVIDSSAIECKSNQATIQNNRIAGGSVLNATSSQGNILRNIIQGGSTVDVSVQTAPGLFNDNTVSDGGSVSVPQNESIIRNNIIHSDGSLTVAVNQARIDRNEIGANITVALVSPNVTAYMSKRAVSEYSNFDVVLDLNDAAIYNGGTLTLTIPVLLSAWVGVYHLTNSNKTINLIANLPTLFATTFDTQLNGETTTFTSVAVAGALANEIIAAQAPGAIAVVGRTNGSDSIQMNKKGTFNAVTGRPNVYQ